jgi:DNA-binding response OmpR family regulator
VLLVGTFTTPSHAATQECCRRWLSLHGRRRTAVKGETRVARPALATPHQAAHRGTPQRRPRRRSRPAMVRLRFADVRMDRLRREVWRGRRPIPLSNTEFELLALLLQHPRRPVPDADILAAIWAGHPRHPNIVKVYVGYLRRKLEAWGEPRLIHTVRGVGYVLNEPPEATPGR